MKKRLLALLLAGTMALSIAGCGASTEENPAPETTPA